LTKNFFGGTKFFGAGGSVAGNPGHFSTSSTIAHRYTAIGAFFDRFLEVRFFGRGATPPAPYFFKIFLPTKTSPELGLPTVPLPML